MLKLSHNIPLQVKNVTRYRGNCVRNLCSKYLKHDKKIVGQPTLQNTKPVFQYFRPVFLINKRFYSDDLPSHNKVLLPALSPTMDMGTIVSWAKKEGDKLNEGDLLAEIETDKATMGFETPEEGYLAKILVPAGTKDVPIGKLVCIIVENEADIAAFKDFKDETTPSKPVSAPSPPPARPSAPAPPVTITPSPAPAQFPPTSFTKSSERVYCSPLAKVVAMKENLDLNSLKTGSGIFASIKVGDLKKATQFARADIAKPQPGKSFMDLPVSEFNYTLAKTLLLSKQTIPHYYLTIDLDLDEILKLKKTLNESLSKDGTELTVNDFIIKASALASISVPAANSAWMDTFIRQYNAVDVSVSILTEVGFISPVVFDADSKGLVQINKDVKAAVNQAREGNFRPDGSRGGTISITNLGSFNVKSILSIINPPQACVLGVGSIQQRLVPEKSAPNGLKISDFMQLTLSCDHRVVDGAVGAQWLAAFRKFMEQPHNMLL